MPAPSGPVFSVAAKYAANVELLALIDRGSDAGSIRLRSEVDVLLAEVPLASPGGAVSAETGVLTLSVAGPEGSAPAGGVVTYAEVCDYGGEAHLTLPVTTGTEAQDGYLVLNNTTVIQGGTVSISSATVG